MEEEQKEYEEVEIAFSVQNDLIASIPDEKAIEMIKQLTEECREENK